MAEKIAPSMLIRFLGVPPALVTEASPAEQDRVRSIVKSVEPLSLRFPGINVDSNPSLRELPLANITAPTLIISARDDGFNTLPAAEFLASKIPGAKLFVYETGGHLLVGHESAVRKMVRNFVASVAQRGRGVLREVNGPHGTAMRRSHDQKDLCESFFYEEDVTAAPAAEHPLKVDPDQGSLGLIVRIELAGESSRTGPRRHDDGG